MLPSLQVDLTNNFLQMPNKNPSLSISCAFDAGAIEVVSLADPADIQLKIRADNAADFAQWFHFRLQGAAGVPLTMRFLNAGQCAPGSGTAARDNAGR